MKKFKEFIKVEIDKKKEIDAFIDIFHKHLWDVKVTPPASNDSWLVYATLSYDGPPHGALTCLKVARDNAFEKMSPAMFNIAIKGISSYKQYASIKVLVYNDYSIAINCRGM